MAQLANSFSTTQAKGNREDLHNVIVMTDPEETPFYSLLPERSVSATKHEWLTDELDAPTLDNAHVEGEQYDYDATQAASRVGNFTQIFHKTFLITETQEVVDKAGRRSEVAYQKVKKGVEMRTDVEVTLLSNNASVAGSDSVARKMGGLRAWLSSNDSLGANGASGGYNASTGVVDAATNGTQRAFSKALLDDVIESTYKNGGKPTVMMTSPYVKRVFSSIIGDANTTTLRTDAPRSRQATIVGAAEAYLSDFGLIDVVPNRQMARFGANVARNAFLLDPTKAHLGVLRKITEDKDVAKTGDAKPCVLRGEMTLIVDNEKAHGVIADVHGMTAST